MTFTLSPSNWLVLAIVFIAHLLFLPVPAKADVVSGLIAHWKFDEGSGATASDSSSGGHTGALVNTPTWVAGKMGSSLQFDGINEYVTTADTPFDFERTDSFTLSMWVKMPPIPAGGQNLLLSKGESSPAFRGLFFYAEPNSSFATKVELINNWETGNRIVIGSTVRVDDNSWHHVVVTYNGSSNAAGINFYTDGIASKGANSIISNTLSGSIVTNRNLEIGGSFANFQFYDGQIDDVRIYERVLTGSDVQSLFSASTDPVPPTSTGEVSLIGHWKFDEGSGVTASDSSSGGHTAALVNSPLWAAGKLGSALQYDGANDYVTTADAPFDFERTDSFTLSMWVKMPPIPAGELNLLLSKAESSPGYRGVFFYAEPNSSFGTKLEIVSNWATGNRIVIGSTGRVDDNNWHHVVVTYDGSSKASGINFYKDGIASNGANSVISSNLSGSILTNRNLEIGASSENSEFYTGQIDDVRIYDGVLTGANVQSLFNGSGETLPPVTPPPAMPVHTGLIGHWKFDEGAGSISSDSSSAGNTAVLMNTPTWTSGKLGSSLQYDGANDFVTTADAPFDFDRTTPFTVSMWVKMPPIPAGQQNLLISKAGPAPSYRGWFLYAEPTSLRGTKIEIVSNWATGDRIIIGSNVRVDDNNWHHVVFTYSGSSNTGGVNFYTDGQPSKNEASTLSNALTGSILTNSNLEIGGASAISQFYSGQIDDVQIYNWAVTPANALALFHAAGTPVIPPPPTGITEKYFQVPSTWTTKIGNSLGARQSVFANPMPGSSDLVDDLIANLSIFGISRGVWSSVHCVATNSDPMVTVTGSGALAESLGWNRLRIPLSCDPPGQADGHVVIINSDDPNWLWEFFGARELVQGTWTAGGIHKWSRTAAVTGIGDGGGKGTEQMYTPGSGSSTSCAASAALAHGTILKAELDAGVVQHALRWSFWAENGNPHAKHYPCRVPWTSEGPAPASREYAPNVGERMMLDPSINVDVLPVGAHMKTILKAAQEYGYIPVDTSGVTETTLHAEKTDWTGYDFSTAGIPNFTDWFHGNSRWVPCVEAFSGECAEPPLNTDPGYYPDEGKTWIPAQTDGLVHTGYTTLEGESPSSSGALAILALRQNGVLVSEAVMPEAVSITEGRFYTEVNARVNTGIAITNSNDSPLTISFFFTDSEGNDFGAGTLTMSANSQISSFLSEPPFSSGTTVGTFTLRSSLPVAVMAVRGLTNERGDFLMTALPVSELTAVAGGLAFPHFMDGAGWSTEVVLINSTDNFLKGAVQFYGDGSSTAPARLLDMSVTGQVRSSLAYSIPPRSFQRLQTPGEGSTLQMGSIRVLPDGSWGPAGVAILKFANTAGITTSESGVAAIEPERIFRVYVEGNGSQLRSGVAISNAMPLEVRVELDLLTLEGTNVASTSLVLPGNGHFSRFIQEIPGFDSVLNSFQGVLQVTGNPSSVAVMGLRIRENERQEKILTTIPAVAEPASRADRTLPFANGGGYTTQFVVFSRGSSAVPTELQD